MAKPDRLTEYAAVDDIIWQDRKRYLGLPLSFTVYKFDANRFYEKKGFLNTKEEEILLYRVLDVSLKRSLWQKIFGVGTIVLSTADQSTPILEVKNVKNSDRVRRALSNIVEKERDEKRVLGKEMFGASGAFDVLDGSGIDHMIDHPGF
ncbi:MAG: PH domain-containing protein [Clostridiales bacterium]|jgi:hypothetical protein|nr:PH domain-containing protein [Clostridiales bacterium]